MNATYPKHVNLIEVGPRDGFQFETRILPTEFKLDIIGGLVEAGLSISKIAHCSKQLEDYFGICDLGFKQFHSGKERTIKSIRNAFIILKFSANMSISILATNTLLTDT